MKGKNANFGKMKDDVSHEMKLKIHKLGKKKKERGREVSYDRNREKGKESDKKNEQTEKWIIQILRNNLKATLH